MLLDKQRDEAHPDWDKSANITFYNGLTDDVKVSHSVVWTLCNPMDYTGQNTGLGSLSLLQGISQPRDWTQVSHIAGGFFTSWATREAQEY